MAELLLPGTPAFRLACSTSRHLGLLPGPRFEALRTIETLWAALRLLYDARHSPHASVTVWESEELRAIREAIEGAGENED